jgi:hypothetical protein
MAGGFQQVGDSVTKHAIKPMLGREQEIDKAIQGADESKPRVDTVAPAPKPVNTEESPEQTRGINELLDSLKKKQKGQQSVDEAILAAQRNPPKITEETNRNTKASMLKAAEPDITDPNWRSKKTGKTLEEINKDRMAADIAPAGHWNHLSDDER